MAATAPVVIAAAERPATLELRDVTRLYRNGRGVRNVDLTVRAGELVALVGPSGAGKTTLLRLLCGLERADDGQVLRAGAPFFHTQRGDARVAMIFQQTRLVGRVDALHNVLAGRLGQVPRWRGLLRRFDDADWNDAFAALDDVGLAGHAADRTDRLSGGEQQRLMIARAIVQRPLALLADEPVASLDPANAQQVMQLLRDCAARGMAVIASLHQPQLAAQYATRTLEMHTGRLQH